MPRTRCHRYNSSSQCSRRAELHLSARSEQYAPQCIAMLAQLSPFRSSEIPFDVPLPRTRKAKGRTVKIREKECVEPPHVTNMRKAGESRLGLCDRLLLVPPGGRIKDIAAAVMEVIEEYWERLVEAWDAKYPENPVFSDEDEENGGNNANEDDA
jgi:hypothetical protein